MSSFIKQLDEVASEQVAFKQNVIANANIILEGYGEENVVTCTLCETASKYLANIALQLKGGKQLDQDEVAAIIAGLRAVADADTREAIGMSTKHLGLVATMTGQNPRITQKLIQIGNHPSFAETKDEVKKMLTSAAEKGDDSIINMINKLRLGYERVQQSVQAA